MDCSVCQDTAPDELAAFPRATFMPPSHHRLPPRQLPLSGHIRKYSLSNTPPLQIPNPLPSKVNAAIAVAQGGEVCHGWSNIKVGNEWAMSWLEGTRPPTTKINWCEEEGA